MNSTSNTSLPYGTPAILLASRLLLASIFIVSALGKLANPAGTIGYITSIGLPAPTLGYTAALLIELVGGVFLVLGYRTRWVAAVLAAFSIVSALVFHHAFGDQNQLFHFLKNIAMAGGLLQVVAYGAGAYGIDNRRAENRALGLAHR